MSGSGKGWCSIAKLAHAFKGGSTGLRVRTPSLMEAYEGWPDSFISCSPLHLRSQ